MALKKPSDFFEKNIKEDVILEITDDKSLYDDLNKVENLFEQISQLQKELSQKVVKNDLESLVISNIKEMKEKFNILQNELKYSNQRDLDVFKENALQLSEIVNNLISKEIPKYRKKVTKNELYVQEKVDELKEEVQENIVNIREDIDIKFNNIAIVVDNNIEYFNQQLQEASSKVNKTTETYNNISKILENKINKEDSKLEEYSTIIEDLQKSFYELKKTLLEESSLVVEQLNNNVKYNVDIISSDIENKISGIKNSVEEKIDIVSEKVNIIEDKVSSEISNIKAEVVIFEKHNKDTKKKIEEFSESLPKVDRTIKDIENRVEELSFETNSTKEDINKIGKDVEVVERYIQNHHKDLEELKEEVFSEIGKLPFGNIRDNIKKLEEKIEFIRETYSKIEPEILVKEVISEGLLNEPSDTKNEDPLTPLNQNFVTLEQLQQHYRLFINRIQQQLATLGGGGETRLKYLDDIVGIATNPLIYDGKFLKYNHSIGKFEFVTVSGGGGGSYDSYWISNNTGISTSSRVAIGTDTATSSLTVNGDAYISGIVTAIDFNSASDIKLKENIKVIDNPIDKILKIDGVNFSWKDTKRNSMGVIAQEIEKVIPELVSGDDLKTVNYNGIVGLLIECVKTQQKQIDDLKKLIDK